MTHIPRTIYLLLCLGALAWATACRTSKPVDPETYRLADSGSHWSDVGEDAVFEDLRPRYAAFFEIILDPGQTRLPDLRPLRDDLERSPSDRRNFDALNSIAIGYFETNYRAESSRGEGLGYLALSQRAAKLLAVPWRAYGDAADARVRDAILDFFEDAGTGAKLHARDTASRLIRVVASLARKEPDAARRARIEELVRRLEADVPEQSSSDPEVSESR